MYLVVPPGGSFPETRRIELGPTALTIGRAEGCEIRVDVPGVDQEHAKISEVALIALGPDCAIGDVPLDQGSRRLLMPGDEIQIGSVVVALEGDDPSIAAAAEGRMAAPVLEGARVRVVEGSNFGDELLLKEEHREYTIGRGASCDLVIEDREVSREHVKVVRRGYNIFVQDQSSTRGSWLGRAAVYTGATVEWARPRMLRVGATVLSLELPEAIRRAAPGAQPSAPMTPPPRSRSRGMPQPTPSAPGVGSPILTPPPAPVTYGAPPPSGMPVTEAATQRITPHLYDPTPQHPHAQHPHPALAGLPPAAVSSAQAVAMAAVAGPAKKGWKKSGPTIGRASGLLLLALAGLAILGALFVVFSLLE
ncbi:MAG TPA: FHA domain-containing protein [Labilithrix sp.]|nr:FHA domain-containing protein [Labilithrix sp.]